MIERGSMEPESQRKLQARYSAAGAGLRQRIVAAVAATGLDPASEAAFLGKRFGVLRKRRDASEYVDVVGYLLNQYPCELALIVTVELNNQFEQRLGYPPIGQIMVAMERWGSRESARWIGCALRNFPKVTTARLAFSVVKIPAVRSLVREDLVAEDAELAEYICSGEIAAPRPRPPPTPSDPAPRSAPEPERGLSDGIEQMPRPLTKAERRGDRLFLHLQVMSVVIVPLLPILGGVTGGWIGAGVGLLTGVLGRIWMRRSMGMRGSNPNDGFFIRKRERADGARRGLLEILIERVRQRPFTRTQCTAITKAWDDFRERLEAAASAEEKRALVADLDRRVKRISYGPE